MVFGTCSTRFMLTAQAIYLAASNQLLFPWDTAPFVRRTIGAWRRIFTRGAVSGVLPGPGVSRFHHFGALSAPLELQAAE